MEIDIHIKLDAYKTLLVISVISLVFILFLIVKNPGTVGSAPEFLDCLANALDIIQFIIIISARH